MIYTLIISLLIEKSFYLLRPQSFSFQIVSEFIYIFVKFSAFMSPGVFLFVETTKLFISNSVRVYRHICEIFYLYVARGEAFDSLFCPEGRVLYTMIVPGGRVFAPFKFCPGGLSRGGWFWMKLIPAL